MWSVQAQEGAVYVVTYIEVAPGAEAQAAIPLKQYGAASRSDPGNLRFETVQRTAPSNQFAIVAIWADQKAFEANRDASHTAQFAKSIQPHLITPFDHRLHSSLAVAGRVAAPAEDKAVFIVTHVDVPHTKRFREVLTPMSGALYDERRHKAM